MLHPTSRDVWLPWFCDGSRLAHDQLLTGPPAVAAHLATLYEPSVLRRTVEAASMYPERLVYQHLKAAGFELHAAPVRAVLVGADGTVAMARDPFAKLRRDWRACEYPQR
eukprot:2428937-Prymnesium_polylepis.1